MAKKELAVLVTSEKLLSTDTLTPKQLPGYMEKKVEQIRKELKPNEQMVNVTIFNFSASYELWVDRVKVSEVNLTLIRLIN